MSRMKYVIDTCLDDLDRINPELSLSWYFSLIISLARVHARIYRCTRARVFSQKSREYFLRIDRPIERSAVARIVTMQFAWRGYRVLAWENDTFTRGVYPAGLVIVVRQMFQLAVYAAIVVLTRHKIPIVSRGGEKRGRKGSVSWLPCVTLIHRAFQ